MKTAKKKKRKTGLGDTNNGGVTITFERIILYALGVAAVGGAIWVAKDAYDKGQKRLEKLDNAGIAAAGTGTTTPTTQNPAGPVTPHILPNPNTEITIPPISAQRDWGVKNTAPDEFPLRYNQGGFRISLLHTALKKLGLGIKEETGWFGPITQNIIKANLGKVTVTEAEFVNFLKLAKMTGREDASLQGLGYVNSQNSILGYLGLI